MSKLYIYLGFFHIIGSYIHGTRSFANQIFINHRICCFLELNKSEVFNSITDWSMKNLLLSMSNMQNRDCCKSHFKPIECSKVTNAHRTLFVNYDLDINESTHIQQSNIISNKNTGNQKINNYLQLIIK